MSSPFSLPRDDCAFEPDSTLEALPTWVDPQDPQIVLLKPMFPKPLWSQTKWPSGGGPSYSNAKYPRGGGSSDVPSSPQSIGQATPPFNMAPPAQTAMGGGGTSLNINVVRAVADGANGLVSVKSVKLKSNPAIVPNFDLVGDAYTLVYIQP